jgi:hypothetical protein
VSLWKVTLLDGHKQFLANLDPEWFVNDMTMIVGYPARAHELILIENGKHVSVYIFFITIMLL